MDAEREDLRAEQERRELGAEADEEGDAREVEPGTEEEPLEARVLHRHHPAGESRPRDQREAHPDERRGTRAAFGVEEPVERGPHGCFFFFVRSSHVAALDQVLRAHDAGVLLPGRDVDPSALDRTARVDAHVLEPSRLANRLHLAQHRGRILERPHARGSVPEMVVTERCEAIDRLAGDAVGERHRAEIESVPGEHPPRRPPARVRAEQLGDCGSEKEVGGRRGAKDHAERGPHQRPACRSSSSSIVFGQSCFRSTDRARSLSSFPSVWQRGQ